MTAAVAGARDPRRQHAFSAYTRVTLLCPTAIATTYALFDRPRADATWAAVALILLVLAAQQVAWLVTSDAWPDGAARGSTAWTSAPALALGCAASLPVVAYGLAEGGSAYVWGLPTAASVAVLVLALARWDREVPQWTTSGLGLSSGLAAIAVVVALRADTGSHPAVVVGTMLGVMLVAITVLVGQTWWDRVVVELTTARNRVVEQAVLEERLRFAGELHDLQGHQLQVILLRADLARTLLETRGTDGIEDCRATLTQISDSARATLRETREIAHGYRRVSLSEEAANAQSVLAAAGLDVSTRGPFDAFEGDTERIAGLLVREATTNILRHSDAGSMSMTVTRTPGGPSLVISDPGPSRAGGHADAGATPGSGLSSIRERARDVGYRLEAARDGEAWTLSLSPPTGADG